MRTFRRSKRKVTKPKVKSSGLFGKLGWTQHGKNAKTLRRIEEAADREKCICETGEQGWCQKHHTDIL